MRFYRRRRASFGRRRFNPFRLVRRGIRKIYRSAKRFL